MTEQPSYLNTDVEPPVLKEAEKAAKDKIDAIRVVGGAKMRRNPSEAK